MKPFPLLILIVVVVALSPNPSSSSSPRCFLSTVKPTSPLITFLEKLQEAALTTFGKSHFDPKLYVDMPLKSRLSDAEAAFDELPRASNGTVPGLELSQFLSEHLEGAGEDMVYAPPPDFVPEPEAFLPRVRRRRVRAWALEVHALWRNLSRRVSMERPELHTLLPLPNPVVIPGSRFREVYYWDSYWIIRGLLTSKMHDTAKSVVGNLISLVHQYGFVLNGSRAYYTNRSQPPLLSAMVRAIYAKTKDVDYVRNSLTALIKEHTFWTTGTHAVRIQDAKGRNHTLIRYYAMWNKPRPESFTLDKESASNISTVSGKRTFYREVATAAETGMDFSTRWMRDPSDFTTLAPTSILPVDLNAFVLGMELDIAALAEATGDSSTYKRFQVASDARKEAIQSVFWNEETGQWLDYWLDKKACKGVHKWKASNQNHGTFASNFIPLWIESFYADPLLVKKVVKSIQKSGLILAAGIVTSLKNSGQQWDYPNGWPPIQHMIIEGLAKSGSEEARLLAKDIAVRWVRTNYVAYQKTGSMHEKYNVEKCGYSGGGGEYAPQTGFGWSNGVVLALLEEFGWPQDEGIGCK